MKAGNILCEKCGRIVEATGKLKSGMSSETWPHNTEKIKPGKGMTWIG